MGTFGALGLCLIYPLFPWVLASPTLITLIAIQVVVAAVFYCGYYACVPSFLAELFPSRRRATAFSITYCAGATRLRRGYAAGGQRAHQRRRAKFVLGGGNTSEFSAAWQAAVGWNPSGNQWPLRRLGWGDRITQRSFSYPVAARFSFRTGGTLTGGVTVSGLFKARSKVLRSWPSFRSFSIFRPNTSLT